MISGECGVRNIYLTQNGKSTILQSPGYPNEYRNDLLCEWYVRTIGTTLVEINIIEFDMENGYDFLIIGQGEAKNRGEMAKLTGQVKLKRLTSEVAQVWMRLATDKTGQRQGFRLGLSRTTESRGEYQMLYC